MLRLNLASQELKEEIKLKHVYVILQKACCFVIVITVFISIVFLFAKIILQNSFNRIVAETTLITKNSQSQDKKITDINFSINSASAIQGDFIVWSFVFEEISRMANDDIKFSSIKIDKAKKSIILKGRANMRDSLILLKENMEKDDIFSNIIFPMKNIMEKENINFEISANLNLDNIKNK